MKILFVSHSSSLYGASKSLIDLIEDLRLRYNITPIVLTPDNGELIYELKKRKIQFIISKYYWWVYLKKDRNPIKIFIKKIINKVYLYKILYLLKKNDIDLVHSNTSVIDIGYHIAKKKNIPHVWHIREDIRNAFNFEYNCSKKIVRKYFEYSKYVIAVSDFIIKQHEDIISYKYFRKVYDGILIECGENKKINSKKLNLCIIGSIDNNKNQLEVIKAIKILSDRNNNNFILNIIGDGDNEYISIIDKYIEIYNLQNYVKFWGYRNDIKDILNFMDIGIMASKNEAFGRVTVEYMSKYMPVIGANSGGTKELIKDGINGFLYELGNEKDLADKIEYFINNKNEIINMGKEGYKIVCKNFDFKINTDKIYELYNN